MAYEPTDNILKLARPLERLMNLPPPLEPGKVTRGALKYNGRQTSFANNKKSYYY